MLLRFRSRDLATPARVRCRAESGLDVVIEVQGLDLCVTSRSVGDENEKAGISWQVAVITEIQRHSPTPKTRFVWP